MTDLAQTLTREADATVFRRLGFAALDAATRLVASLGRDQAEVLDAAVRGGARLVLEVGPMPAFEAATLWLVEAEGRRHRVGSFEVAPQPVAH